MTDASLLIPRVVDISHHNEGPLPGRAIDFAAVAKAGIWGVIHKATEGLSTSAVDATYAPRRKQILAAGLLHGAYHFLRPGNITAQVSWFLSHAQPDQHTLLALDHEDPAVSLDDAQAFIHGVFIKIGRYPILYSGFLIKEQLGDRPSSFWSKRKLWLCHYNAHPTWPKAWAKPFLIQYTGDGMGPPPHSIPGIKTQGIDLNTFDGTRDELAAQWAT